MKFILIPSLKQMTMVKIAAELWNQVDISHYNFQKDYLENKKERQISSYDSQKNYSKNLKGWQRIEDQVIEIVSHLPLPEPSKKNLLRLIRPIGRQIRLWRMYHRREEVQILKLPDQFCWKPEGTIDRKMAAEMLVKDEDIESVTRYELACINCLEDKIPELWNGLSEQQKKYYYYHNNESIIFSTNVHHLVQFWSCQMAGQMFKLEDIIQVRTKQSNPDVYGLELALFDGNRVAFEYFYKKLSDEERDLVLVEYAEHAANFHDNLCTQGLSNSEVFHFLFSRMTEDQQIQSLSRVPHCAFKCRLDWPFQPFFMVLAKLITHLLPEGEHILILELISTKIADGWTDFDYRQLFRGYWNLIPLAHKTGLIRQTKLLYKLIVCGEEGIVKSMFKSMGAFEKEGFILSKGGRDLCVRLVNEDRWRWLELLIELCGPSKEVIVKIKERLMEPIAWHNMWDREFKSKLWKKRFCQLLDDFIAKKSEKRMAENDDVNLSKKLRTD